MNRSKQIITSPHSPRRRGKTQGPKPYEGKKGPGENLPQSGMSLLNQWSLSPNDRPGSLILYDWSIRVYILKSLYLKKSILKNTTLRSQNWKVHNKWRYLKSPYRRSICNKFTQICCNPYLYTICLFIYLNTCSQIANSIIQLNSTLFLPFTFTGNRKIPQKIITTMSCISPFWMGSPQWLTCSDRSLK